MSKRDLAEWICQNNYPGRGIAMGISEDGQYGVIVYFIMGRSEISQSRMFVRTSDGIIIKLLKTPQLTDHSLIVYTPVRKYGEKIIVTNGDQTDTIHEYLAKGMLFEDALRTRSFEQDAPHYTPRISGMMSIHNSTVMYQLSIIKSGGHPELPLRFFFNYPGWASGEGHYIHTYCQDAHPLPSFIGEPKQAVLSGNIDTFTENIWNSLNTDKRISLFVLFRHLQTGREESRIINKFCAKGCLE
jgi:IMP cyclohydrolase